MKGLAKFYLLVAWSIFILMLTTTPLSISDVGGVDITDKIVHFVFFGVFFYLFLEFIKLYINLILAKILAFITTASYAINIELLQIFIPGRYFSYIDIFAGLLGGLAVLLGLELVHMRKPSLLLQVCCIGCGAYVSKILKKDYRVSLFFYNPNIFPKTEYDRRLTEANRIAKRFGLKLIRGEYEHQEWLDRVEGHELDKEKGERCFICYRERLEKAAMFAKKAKFDYFASTLSISPHKDARALSEIGKELEKKYNVKFFDEDFKKKDGFKNSTLLSKELGLYRQNYCGCEFSLRDQKQNK